MIYDHITLVRSNRLDRVEHSSRSRSIGSINFVINCLKTCSLDDRLSEHSSIKSSVSYIWSKVRLMNRDISYNILTSSNVQNGANQSRVLSIVVYYQWLTLPYLKPLCT